MVVQIFFILIDNGFLVGLIRRNVSALHDYTFGYKKESKQVVFMNVFVKHRFTGNPTYCW